MHHREVQLKARHEDPVGGHTPAAAGAGLQEAGAQQVQGRHGRHEGRDEQRVGEEHVFHDDPGGGLQHVPPGAQQAFLQEREQGSLTKLLVKELLLWNCVL